MDSYTQFATQMHRYRADQFTGSADRARLLARLPREARTLKLRIERLLPGKKVQPVRSPAREVPA